MTHYRLDYVLRLPDGCGGTSDAPYYVLAGYRDVVKILRDVKRRPELLYWTLCQLPVDAQDKRS